MRAGRAPGRHSLSVSLLALCGFSGFLFRDRAIACSPATFTHGAGSPCGDLPTGERAHRLVRARTCSACQANGAGLSNECPLCSPLGTPFGEPPITV